MVGVAMVKWLGCVIGGDSTGEGFNRGCLVEVIVVLTFSPTVKTNWNQDKT